VAGFIGRTNLLEGRVAGERIVFDHFDLPRGLFESERIVADGEVLFSVRPHSLALDRQPRPDDGPIRLEAQLVERAFLGESWDYIVSPVNSEVRLKVAATPAQVFEVGETLWLKLDPQQMALLTG
jgi:iron(III) transport system ATP-binding protein